MESDGHIYLIEIWTANSSGKLINQLELGKSHCPTYI